MIHPRRLKGAPTNIARYYTVGDYYTKGSDEHSEWGGALAADLGLKGKVDPAVLKDLLGGKVAGQQLGRLRHEGGIEHHPGWDFAVNAPKSVSIMALVMGDERIIAAHERAVGTALAYLEEHATLRRREDGQIVHETTGRFLVARFTEHASRELDPHLHTHAVVLNMTNREDGGPMASLETRAMYAAQMTAGQVYRNDLAHAVRELGYEIDSDPRTGLFEIRGVSDRLIDAFSQRAEQIDAYAEEHGLEGQAARRKAFYATRPAKERLALDDLHGRWAKRSSFDREDLQDLRDGATRRDVPIEPATAARATLFGIRQTETREAVNEHGRMLRAGLASHVGEVRLGDVRPRMDEHEDRRKLLTTREPTGGKAILQGRTTRRTARLEQALAQHIALGLDDARPIARADRILPILETAGLTPQQEQALVSVALTRDRVSGIHGVAGAGKSMLVGTLRAAAEPGTQFIALAPTSSAAANLGQGAGIPSRTVASLLAGGGRGLTPDHILILDEAGQLGNRQALRMLEISRLSGARLLLLGDNSQTGAIEQGKPFWLMQKLGLPTAELTESMRQQTRSMKVAVTRARAGDYAGSMAALDRVASGGDTEDLARDLVAEWTRLGDNARASTNILVLENRTRQFVHALIRDTLKREGALAAEDARLEVLSAAPMTDQEKLYARFYARGQVLTFGRDVVAAGIARDTEYLVVGLGREAGGRQIVRLVDGNGQIIRWDPRLGQVRHVNVFNVEERNLAEGDRIQWRLVNHDLGLKNADRGTVEKLVDTIATIRWDRDRRVQDVDLDCYRTWDHGYAETVYSAQSKTYGRVYVLAPVGSALVNGQNYYTAITRARFGVKLWTEDAKALADKLATNSGEKTSSLEGLGRLEKDGHRAAAMRHPEQLGRGRAEQERWREERRQHALGRRPDRRPAPPPGIAEQLAKGAREIAVRFDRFLQAVLDRERTPDRASANAPTHTPAGREPHSLGAAPHARGPER
ncbi:MobF family relaxase [Sphingomonas sp. 1185]|uniref:MobF family relaxase n=1 Tax=Sphingomonas sp. 1185 TaxID=3156411 RepID=UPI003396BE02